MKTSVILAWFLTIIGITIVSIGLVLLNVAFFGACVPLGSPIYLILGFVLMLDGVVIRNFQNNVEIILHLFSNIPYFLAVFIYYVGDFSADFLLYIDLTRLLWTIGIALNAGGIIMGLRKEVKVPATSLAQSIQRTDVRLGPRQLKMLLTQYKLAAEAVNTLANHLLATFFGVFLSFAGLSGIALQGMAQGLLWTRYLVISNYLLILTFILFYYYTYKRIQFNQEMSRLIEDAGGFNLRIAGLYDQRKKSWGIARSIYLAVSISLQLFIANTVLLYFFFLSK